LHDDIKGAGEIFSFHLAHRFILSPLKLNGVPGLNHWESFFAMHLGAPILSLARYRLQTFAFFAWWRNETFLDDFLQRPSYGFLGEGWHVRMRLYRRWGEITELRDAIADPSLAAPGSPVIAVTLARLRLLQTPRFIRWGKPVESQVRNHKGQTLALAALRPLNTFSTFSVWKNEAEMTGMVLGRNAFSDGESHHQAMQERARKDFHREFSTMRFVPFKEAGRWNGKSGYTEKPAPTHKPSTS